MATGGCLADVCFIDCLTPATPRANSESIAKARSHTAKFSWRKRVLLEELLAIQRHGNSDPFDSLAAPVTARIAHAINFRKAQYVPACPFSRTPLWATHRNGQRPRSTVIHNELAELCKPNSAKSFMLHLVSMYARISNNDNEWRHDILKLRVESANILRKAVERGIHQDVTNAIQWLFADAVLAANLREALFHGMALRQFFASARNVDKSNLINVLWLDSHLAMMFMRRPIFDPSWASKQFNIEVETFGVRHGGYEIECLLPVDLAEIAIQFYNELAAWRCSERPLTGCDVSVTVGWIVAHSHIRKSRLINIYIDNSDSLLGCMALAFLCLDMTQGCDPVLKDKRLMTSLQSLMARFYSSMRTRIRPGNAELWCLYVGALIEQRELSYATQAWFNRAFASVARLMGLSSWRQIFNILKRFVYSELIEPAGDVWVEKTLHANVEDRAEPLVAAIPSWVHLNG